MSKKGKIAIILSLVVIAAVLGTILMILWTPKVSKVVAFNGYEIKIPANWSSDSKGNLYDKSGYNVGSFTLVNDSTPIEINFSGVEFAENITKYDDYLIDGTPAVLYNIENLPNPEPFGAQVVFFDDYVNERLADKIVRTFKIPQFGKNPPQKNIALPDEENSVVEIEFTDKSVAVKNSILLGKIAEKLKSKESYGVNVITYKEVDSKRVISDWRYIECDDGVVYLYTYYNKGDGIYTYDNNAVSFTELSKVIDDENETTAYILKKDGAEDITLIEFPLNRYRDNAEELVALKTDSATSADIQSIIDKIMNKQELNKISFEIKDGVLTISFNGDVKADRPRAYSHSAVIFSLAENIDTVIIKYSNAEYTFTREVVDKAVGSEIGEVAKDPESFVEYTEKLEQTNIRDGEVVYTGTVIISYNTIVTHPRTGERVEIGPYAENRGYGYLLGKPINCVIKRYGSGYVATASSNGSNIMSYPLEDDAKLQWAINMIKAYS